MRYVVSLAAAAECRQQQEQQLGLRDRSVRRAPAVRSLGPPDFALKNETPRTAVSLLCLLLSPYLLSVSVSLLCLSLCLYLSVCLSVSLSIACLPFLPLSFCLRLCPCLFPAEAVAAGGGMCVAMGCLYRTDPGVSPIPHRVQQIQQQQQQQMAVKLQQQRRSSRRMMTRAVHRGYLVESPVGDRHDPSSVAVVHRAANSLLMPLRL